MYQTLPQTVESPRSRLTVRVVGNPPTDRGVRCMEIQSIVGPVPPRGNPAALSLRCAARLVRPALLAFQLGHRTHDLFDVPDASRSRCTPSGCSTRGAKEKGIRRGPGARLKTPPHHSGCSHPCHPLPALPGAPKKKPGLTPAWLTHAAAQLATSGCHIPTTGGRQADQGKAHQRQTTRLGNTGH